MPPSPPLRSPQITMVVHDRVRQENFVEPAPAEIQRRRVIEGARSAYSANHMSLVRSRNGESSAARLPAERELQSGLLFGIGPCPGFSVAAGCCARALAAPSVNRIVTSTVCPLPIASEPSLRQQFPQCATLERQIVCKPSGCKERRYVCWKTVSLALTILFTLGAAKARGAATGGHRNPGARTNPKQQPDCSSRSAGKRAADDSPFLDRTNDMWFAGVRRCARPRLRVDAESPPARARRNS